MSSYYPSFNYLGINSREKNLVVAHFDADQGEMDTFLGMEPIYTENADGTNRLDYGAKFNNVATIKLSVIKPNGEDFSVLEVREALKWLTGARHNSALDLTEHFIDEFTGDGETTVFKFKNKCDHVYGVSINGNTNITTTWGVDSKQNTITFDPAPIAGRHVKVTYNRIKYSFIGRVTNAWQQKMDARTVGLIFEFTSTSPWAYSPMQDVTKTIGGKTLVLDINCESDDLYGYIYPNVRYKSYSDNDTLIIKNTTVGNEETKVTGLANNEVIRINNNMMITSDNSNKSFGTSFNFVFPRLVPGVNTLEITGSGIVTFEYVTPLKVGDCVMDMSAASDPICNEYGEIQVDMLDWKRISNTPTTLAGYGITDAYTTSAVYNKNEIDSKISSVSSKAESAASLASNVSSNFKNYYTKSEIDNSMYAKKEVDDKFDDYYKKSETYTKNEVNREIANITSDIENNKSSISQISSRLTNEHYNKNYIDDNYYSKSQIDSIISELEYDPSTGENESVAWSQITGKPTTLSGYGVKSEVQAMIDTSRNEMLASDIYTRAEIDALIASVQISIDEEELNAMLKEVLV